MGGPLPHTAPAPARPEEDPEEIVAFLERDQTVHDRLLPLPRRALSPLASHALWALRVFTVLIGALVIYTFFATL